MKKGSKDRDSEKLIQQLDQLRQLLYRPDQSLSFGFQESPPAIDEDVLNIWDETSPSLCRIDRAEVQGDQESTHRLKGGLLLRQHDSNAAKAQGCFERAIEVARGQSAKSWELRATTSLARLLASQGNRDEARTMLAAIYNWFTEGFDTADLKDAKALLDELGG